jgi:hypothetical protein
MPWCEGCDRFLNPNTLRSDGSCPVCERKVADSSPTTTMNPDPPSSASSGSPTSAADLAGTDLPASATDVPKAPWHFKVLIVVTVVYLGWRFAELISMAVT